MSRHISMRKMWTIDTNRKEGTTIMRLLIAAIGVVGIIIISGSAAASAAASSTPRYPLCASHGSGLCLNLPSNSNSLGQPIDMEPEAQGAAQDISLLAPNTCGQGFVTSTCPFNIGSGNNATFKGDEIFELHFSDHSGRCLGLDHATGGIGIILQNCTGSSNAVGTIWVFENYADHSSRLISVRATNNAENTVEYLDSDGLGNVPYVDSSSDKAPSYWAIP